MTLTIDIKDSVADKILYFLENFKNDVKILKKENDFLVDMKKSQNDLESGDVIEIVDVDKYIDKLQNEIIQN